MATIVLIPIIVIYIYSDKILVAMHQEPAIAKISRHYCCLLIPGIWAQAMFDATRKFMSAQLEFLIPLYIQAFTLALHLIMCWVFIVHLGMRENGAILATNITYILNMLIIDTCCYFIPKFRRAWKMPDKRVFDNMWDYFKVGLPGACMLCFEWWCFELLAIFSGLMSVEALAAEVIIVNLVSFIFMVPLGISMAASSLTGVYLGLEMISHAKKFSRLAILFNVLITIIILIILKSCQVQIAELFTKDKGTNAIIYDVINILCFYIFFDTIHGVQSGIIRGLGLQKYGSIYTLICYYPIGLVSALCLAFRRDMGVYGLWLGFSIACVILDLGFVVIIEYPDWYKISKDMQKTIDLEKLHNMSADSRRCLSGQVVSRRKFDQVQ